LSGLLGKDGVHVSQLQGALDASQVVPKFKQAGSRSCLRTMHKLTESAAFTSTDLDEGEEEAVRISPVHPKIAVNSVAEIYSRWCVR
jgi:hypothetical protein